MNTNFAPLMNYGLLGAYTETSSYDYNVTERLPYNTAAMTALRSTTALNVAIKANEDYIPRVRAYYDARVSRTSGGKRDRLRAERADLINEANAANAFARKQIEALNVVAISAAKGNLPDYTPGTVLAVAAEAAKNAVYGPAFHTPTSGVPAAVAAYPILPLAIAAGGFLLILALRKGKK